MLVALVVPGAVRANAEPSAPVGTHVAKVSFVGDRIVDLDIVSAAMGGETMDVKLLLPKDWRSKPGARFPVLYLLPGYGTTENQQDWVDKTDVELFMADKNVVVAMPEAGATGMYSDWLNSGAGAAPAWETFHTVELPRILEREWRANDRRAVAGLSMGGLGAMNYAARHPGFYDAAASYSGFLHTTMPPMQALLIASVAAAGQDPMAIWGDPVTHRSNWEAHDPWILAEKLRGTELYVSAAAGVRGGRDPHVLDVLNKAVTSGDPVENLKSLPLANALETLSFAASLSLVQKLTSLGIDADTHFPITGTHSWGWWGPELERSWPTLARGLGLPA